MSLLEGRNPGGYLGMRAWKPSHDTPQEVTRQWFLCRVERIPGAHDNPRIGGHRHASVPVGAALVWMEMANVVVPGHDELSLPIHRRRVGHPFGVVVEQSVVFAPVPDDRATGAAAARDPLGRGDRSQPIAEPAPGNQHQMLEHPPSFHSRGGNDADSPRRSNLSVPHFEAFSEQRSASCATLPRLDDVHQVAESHGSPGAVPKPSRPPPSLARTIRRPARP